MLLSLKILVAPLLLFYVVRETETTPPKWRGCTRHMFGETTLHTAATFRDNLINVLGFLEKQKIPDVPQELYAYFTSVRKRIITNSFDIFRLLTYIRHMHTLRTSQERTLFILKELEKVEFRRNCRLQCSISRWEIDANVRNLLGVVPYNLTIHGLPEKDTKLLEFTTRVGGEFMLVRSPKNNVEKEINADFGPSVMRIVREIKKSKHCFNENFFGNLLPFYPWPERDATGKIAVARLRHYFTRGYSAFLPCNIFMSDTAGLLDQPWVIFDYILSQMDSTNCERQLDLDIKKLMNMRQAKDTGEIARFDAESLLDLLSVITPDTYPHHIILARDRVYKYLSKLLPYVDQQGFVRYLHDSPEQQLLALLDYVAQIDPYPIPDINYCMKAIKSQLLFQKGKKLVTTKLLNFIYDAWWTPDLLDEPKQAMVELKLFIKEHFVTIDNILSSHVPQYCTGIIPCYMRIVSMLEAHLNFSSVSARLQPPSCFIGAIQPCLLPNGSVSVAPPISDIESLLQTITYQKYGLRVIMATQRVLDFVKKHHININTIRGGSICTKDAALLHTLETALKNQKLLNIRNDIKLIVAEINRKIGGQISEPTILDESPSVNIPQMNTQMLMNTVLRIQDKQETVIELDAALLYIQHYAPVIDEWLRLVKCDLDVASCFGNILDVIKAKKHEHKSLNVNVLRFVLSPTVCNSQFCWWLPYEEKECGVLNPLLAYLINLLETLKDAISHFQLQMDLDAIIELIKLEDVGRVLYEFPLNPTWSPRDTVVAFLRKLQHVFNWHEAIRLSSGHLIEFLTASETPKHLTIQNLFHLSYILIKNTTDEEVASSMKENVQLLFKSKERLHTELTMVNVDCSTIESCVATLALECNITSGNAIINTILSIVTPKLCKKQTCPWISNITPPNRILGQVLNELVAIARDDTTPLVVVFAIERLKKFLQSTEFHPILKELEPLIVNDNNVLTTVLTMIMRKSNLISMTRRDAQNIYNYIRNKIPPQNMNVNDLIKLLLQLKEETTNADIKDHIRKVLADIQNNISVWENILSKLYIDCQTLMLCIRNVLETLQLEAHNHVVQGLVEILKNVTKPETPDVDELMKEVEGTVEKLVVDVSTPFHIQLDLKQILKVIGKSEARPAFESVTKVQPIEMLIEVLEHLPLEIKLYHKDIEQNIANVIKYYTSSILSTRMNIPTLKELALVLSLLTESDRVKNEIITQMVTFEQLPVASEILLQLPVKCDSFQSCVDSITRNVRQLPVQNQGTQTVYLIVNPPSCTFEVCTWIRGNVDEEIRHKVDALKQDLIGIVQKAQVPLLVKIYAEEILEYITPDLVASLQVSTLPQLFTYIVQGNFEERLQRMALALMRYFERNVVPTVWTHNDFLGLSKVLIASTTDTLVQREIKETTSRLLYHGVYIDQSLQQCTVTGNDLKTVVYKLYECALVHQNEPAAQQIIQYLFPKHCKIYTCPWIIQQPRTSISKLIQSAINEIDYLINNDKLPFHIKLELKEIRRVLQSNRFLEEMKNYNFNMNINNDFKTLIDDAKPVLEALLPRNMTHESGFCKLLPLIPNNMFTGYNIFRNVLNVLSYLVKQILPKHLQVNTLQQLAIYLASLTTDRLTAMHILSQAQKIVSVRQVSDWMNLLIVNCETMSSCIKSITQAITTQNIASDLHHIIESILRPLNCTKPICPWLEIDSTAQKIALINELKAELVRLLHNPDAPLAVIIAINQILRYINPETVQHLVSDGVTLVKLLESISQDSHFNYEIQQKTVTILKHIQNQGPSTALSSCADLHELAQQMLQNVQDFLIQQEIKVLDNRLRYHENECDHFVKQCQINCVDLRTCVRELYECTRNQNTSFSKILSLFLSPPSCTPATCKWVTGTEQNTTLIEPQIVIIFFPVGMNQIKVVMFDLNNQDLVKQLLQLSTVVDTQQTTVTVVKVTVSPNEYMHIPIDLTNRYVQSTLISSKYAMQPIIDCNKMTSVAVLWPFRDGRIRWLTFDLNNSTTRRVLKRLGQRPCLPDKPSIAVRDVDGSEFLLCVDYHDTLLLHELLQISVEGRRIITKPSLLFWPQKGTECWGAIEIDKLNNAELAVIQHFPCTPAVGVSIDMLVTSGVVIPFCFDVYNRYVQDALHNLGHGQIPTIDVQQSPTEGFIIPNDYGRVTNVYVTLTPSRLAQLRQLSVPHFSSAPSFYFKQGDQVVPICLNLNNINVKNVFENIYSIRNDSNDFIGNNTEAVAGVIRSLVHLFNQYLTRPDIPFIIKLDIKALLNVFQIGRPEVLNLFLKLPGAVLAKLNEIITLMEVHETWPGQLKIDLLNCLESLPYGFLEEFGVKWNVLNIIEYLKDRKVTIKFHLNTFEELLRIIASNVQNASVVSQVNDLIKNIVTHPNLVWWLPTVNIACETYEYCINNIGSIIQQLPPENEIRRMLQQLYDFCNIGPAGDKELPSAMKEVLQQIVSSIEVVLQKDLPLSIKLNLEAIAALLKTEETQQKLQEILQTLSKESVRRLIEHAENLIRALINNPSTVAEDAITQFLQILPFGFVTTMKLEQTIDQITQFFLKGTTPSKLNIYILAEIAKILANTTTDHRVIKHINEFLNRLKNESTNAPLFFLEVDCSSTVQKCIDNIVVAMQHLPVIDSVTKWVEGIIKPPLCTVETCPWIVPEKPPISPIEELLATVLELLLQTKDARQPLHIVLDIEVLTEILTSESVRKLLQNILKELPEWDVKEMEAKSQALLQRLRSTNPPSLSELIQVAFENLPNTFVNILNVGDNIINIRKYFQTNVPPTRLNLHTFKKLIKYITQKINSHPAQTLLHKLEALVNLPNINDILGQLVVKCYTLNLCIDSLVKSLLTNPSQSDTTHMLIKFINEVTHIVNNATLEIVNGTDYAVLPLDHGRDFVLLDLRLKKVLTILEAISEKMKPRVPTIMLEIPGDGARRKRTIMLDLNDPTTIKLLHELELLGLKPLQPTRIINQFGAYIVGIMYNRQHQLQPFIIRDDDKTYQRFLFHNTSQTANTINLPFQNGIVNVPVHPYEIVKQETIYFYYLPGGADYQPGGITLPSGEVVFIDWSKLTLYQTPNKGTVVPILGPDGTYGFIRIDLQNSTLINKILRQAITSQFQPPPKSMLVFTVPDAEGNIVQVVLNLNDYSVLRNLVILSQRVDKNSDSLIVFNLFGDDGKITPILFDLKHLNLNQLLHLGQSTPLNLAPIYIRDEKTGTDAIVFMVQDDVGRVRPVILKVNDLHVINTLIRISDATNPRAIPIYLKGPDGRIIKVLIDKSNPQIVRELLLLTEGRIFFDKPLPNISPGSTGSTHVLVDHPTKGKTYYKIKVDSPETIQRLKDLAQLAPPNAPFVHFETSDGRSIWLKLDVNRPDVIAVLEEIAQQITSHTPARDIIVLVPPNHPPIVIKISIPSVLNQLVNISLKGENKPGLTVITVIDAFDKIHTIILDLNDANTVRILEKLQGQTNQINPVPILTADNTWVTALTFVDENGIVQSVLIDGRNQSFIDIIKGNSNPLNPSATAVMVYDETNTPITFYLDLKDPEVRRILVEGSKSVTVTPIYQPPSPSKGTIMVPTYTHGEDVVLSCNISKDYVAKVLLKLSTIRGTNPLLYRLVVPDWTGTNKVIAVDVANPQVVHELNRVCVRSPVSDDLLLITVKDENNHTKSFVLNTKDTNVMTQLLQISNMTRAQPNQQNVSIVLMPDDKGHHFKLYLDLSNPYVLTILEELHQISIRQIPSVTLLRDEHGEKTVLVLVLRNEHGGYRAVVLDTTDPDVQKILQQISNPSNPDAIKIEVSTSNGKLVFYIDRHNVTVMSDLIKLSQERKQRPPLIVPPLYITTDIVSIPFIVGERTLFVTIDLSNPETKKIVQSSSVAPSSTTTIIHVKDAFGKIVPCYIDKMDEKLAQELIRFSVKYEYFVSDDSLLIVPVINPENGKSEYVILDLNNANVTQTLQYITTNFGNEENKVPFHYYDRNRLIQVCKLDFMDVQTVRELLKLQYLTPAWITPMLIINPYGPLPFLVFTIQDHNGNVKPIVIDTNDQGAIKRLEAIQTAENQAKKPLKLTYTTSDGVHRTIHLDAAQPHVIQTLIEVSKPSLSYPKEIITNHPIIGSMTPTTLVLPVESENQLLLLGFDTSNPDVFNGILGCAAPPDEEATVIYIQNLNGDITAIRINTKDEDVVTRLKYLSKNQRVKMDATSLLVFVVPGGMGSDTIILDVSNPEVIEELQKLSTVTLNNASTVLITVSDGNGNPIPISLDVNYFNVIERLKRLQEKTPKKILPVVFPNPIAPRPLIVLTLEDEWKKPIGIVIDTNIPRVVTELIGISQPNDTDAYVVLVQNAEGTYIPVYINPENPIVKQKLIYLASLCRVLPIPIVGYNPNQVIVVPVQDTDGKTLHILLDPTDRYAMDLIAHFPQTTGPSVILALPDSSGVIRPVKIDKKDNRIISMLKQLGRRVCNIVKPRVIPPAGALPLLVMYKVVQGTVHTITIDPNNPETVKRLLAMHVPNDRDPHIIRLKLPIKNGKIITVNLPDIPDTVSILLSISETVPVGIQPLKVVLPGKRKPLVCLTIPEISGFSPVTIDVESDEILEELKYFDTARDFDTITIEFDTPRTKTSINLNIKDPKVVEKLKSLLPKVPVVIIPQPTGYPIISLKLEDGEEILLDTNNEEVVNYLIRLSLSPDNGYYPQTEITLGNKDELIIPVRIAFGNPKIIPILKKLALKTPLPPVKIGTIHLNRTLEKYPIRIVPPGRVIYPLIFLETRTSSVVTLDPNNYQVMHLLSHITNTTGPHGGVPIWLSSTKGDLMKFVLNLDDSHVIEEVKRLTKLCPIKIEPKPAPYLPTLIVKVSDRFNKKPPLTLDLQNPEVLNTLLSLSRTLIFAHPYKLQINTNLAQEICLIDFNDPRVIKALERFKEGTSKEPFFVTFDVPDTFGNTWQIVLDLENNQVMEKLMERSNLTASHGATIIDMQTKNGTILKVKLNLYDVNTINLLKALTLQSTGKPADMVQKKPRRIIEFTVTMPNGQSLTFKIDTNNESVMKKLKQLSNMFNGQTPSILNIPLSDGSTISLKFDYGDAITIQNLRNLQAESTGSKAMPLIPLQSQTGTGQTMLTTFNINSPNYGDVTITLDLFLPGIMDQLRQLAAAFVAGRPETQVPIDDQRGNHILLRLDVTNPQTIEILARLTKESTGKDPLYGRVPTKTHTPELLTIEQPYGIEVLPITFDQKDPLTISQLMQLNHKGPDQALTTIDIEVDNKPVRIALNFNDRKVVAQLLSFAVPTVFPTVAPKLELITLIFLPVGGSLLPIMIDLARRENVLSIIALSQKYEANFINSTYVEVRDDTGQYLRVPLDLSNHALVSELTSKYPPQQRLNIDATTMPFLTFVLPGRNGPGYSVVKLQTKPKVLKVLKEKMAMYNGQGTPIHITDILKNKHDFALSIQAPQFVQIIASLETAAVILPPRIHDFFIIYAVDRNGEIDPVYLNMQIQRTVEAVQSIQYVPSSALTAIQYKDKAGQLRYNFVSIVDKRAIEFLSPNSYVVGGHSISKQTLVNNVILTIPAGNGSMRITLNLADPRVLQELHDITNQTAPSHTVTTVEIDDAYGFPLVLKFDHANPNVIARLKALDNPY